MVGSEGIATLERVGTEINSWIFFNIIIKSLVKRFTLLVVLNRSWIFDSMLAKLLYVA